MLYYREYQRASSALYRFTLCLCKCAYLGIDEGDAVSVASEAAHGVRVRLREGAAVPHLAEAIVPCREYDLRGLVSECHSIRIILVGINLVVGGGCG